MVCNYNFKILFCEVLAYLLNLLCFSLLSLHNFIEPCGKETSKGRKAENEGGEENEKSQITITPQLSQLAIQVNLLLLTVLVVLLLVVLLLLRGFLCLVLSCFLIRYSTLYSHRMFCKKIYN